MMLQALGRYLVIVIVAMGVWLLPSAPAIAQIQLAQTQPASPTTINPPDSDYEAYQEVMPNFDDISFRDLGTVDQGGDIDFQGIQRSWNKGDYVPEILTIGDVSALGGQALSIDQIDSLTGLDFSGSRLSDFTLATEQTLGHLTEAVPYLGDYQIGDVEPIEALIADQASQISFNQLGFRQQTINNFLSSNPTLSDIKLGDIDLDSFSITDIPNLEVTQISRFEGWDQSKISEVPGLENVPLSQFPNGITGLEGIIARIDVAWGTAESDETRTISGSYQVGFEVPCPDGGQLTKRGSPYQAPEANDPPECAHIELDDLEDAGRKVQGAFEGKQWISGKYQEVEGGFGLLKIVPSPLGYSIGMEPTGRHPLVKYLRWSFGNRMRRQMR
jgi:hypothetical protein